MEAVMITRKMEIKHGWKGAWVYPRYNIRNGKPITEEDGHVKKIGAEDVNLVKFFSVDVPGNYAFRRPNT